MSDISFLFSQPTNCKSIQNENNHATGNLSDTCKPAIEDGLDSTLVNELFAIVGNSVTIQNPKCEYKVC